MQQPEQSLPKQTAQWKDLKAAYRLLSHRQVDPQAIQRPHRQQTLAACVEHAVVLCVQDTTELDFTSHRKVTNLGQIGNGGGRGLVQHTTLAVVPSAAGAEPTGATLLGVLDERWYRRTEVPEQETRRQRQARWTEADVWSDAAAAVAALGATSARLVHVGDRHSDVFGFMNDCRRLGHGFVLRAEHNRYVNHKGHQRLWSCLRSQPVATTLSVKVRGQQSRPGQVRRRSRTVKVQVRYASITLPPPRNDPRTAEATPIACGAVLVEEIDPPAEADTPLQWMLLSSTPVQSVPEALRIIGYYRCRWVIEEWHRALKEGCKLQSSQLDDAADLQRLASIQSVIAVRLLQMREQADHAGDDPAALRATVPPLWIALVAALARQPPASLSPRTFWLTLAKQGGYPARRRDPRPGWKVIWRGWYDIQRMVQGAQLIRATGKCG